MPPNTVHPYYFHNLGSWVAPSNRVLISSWSSDDHWHYALIEEPEPGDYLVGAHESGETLAVNRPSHFIVRGESLSLPGQTASEIIQAAGVPLALTRSAMSELGETRFLGLFLEKYGDDQNPGLETTHKQRPRMNVL